MSFRNEPILELRRAPARESLLEALRGLDARLPLEVPLLVGEARPRGGLQDALHRRGHRFPPAGHAEAQRGLGGRRSRTARARRSGRRYGWPAGPLNHP